MIGPCGLGLILLEVGVAGRLKPKISALFLFWAHVAALLAILENPTTYIRFLFSPGRWAVLCEARTHVAVRICIAASMHRRFARPMLQHLEHRADLVVCLSI